METIEELKQSNAKLTERLNNAAKFFREQKAQIEALTKDKEDLVKKVDDYNKQLNEYELKLQSVENNETQANWKAKCEELEKTIQLKDQAYKVLQDTYNEVFAEKEKITKQYKEQEKFETEVINKKVPELEAKLSNVEAAYKELQNKYKSNDIARGEAELKAENIQAEYTKKFKDQDTQIESLKNKLEAEVNNNAYALDNAHKEFEKVNTELKEVKANREEFRSQLVDLEKKYDQLNKLYEDCEAEKLSTQADYDQLQEKIKYIEANNISDKEWQDHLEYVIEQIRNLADDVINPKSAPNKIKENVMKRTGDYNVSGENIGI